jgi:hypothetical protein
VEGGGDLTSPGPKLVLGFLPRVADGAVETAKVKAASGWSLSVDGAFGGFAIPVVSCIPDIPCDLLDGSRIWVRLQHVSGSPAWNVAYRI